MKKLFILLISLIILFYISFVPHIVLNGPGTLRIESNTKYKELGIKTYSIKKYKEKIIGKVDTSKLGTYLIEYKIGPYRKTRKVIVEDKTNPNIKLNGNKDTNVCSYDSYQDEGVVVIDNYDGDITNKVKIKRKDDKIIYSVIDSNGNESKKIRNLVLKDEEAPTIRLNGNNLVYIQLGDSYTDEGAVAIDNCDGNITNINIINNVNTNVLGEYKVIYEAIDSSNNKTILERIVKVIPEEEKVVYLTFDDGPSNSITPKLLDILNEQNVKATFFVINHSDDLNYLIKREYDEGHVVALHSYTHNYGEIYSSVDAYFNDLNLISNKVKNIIGKEVKLIRFPGGSSNTISSFNPGIMTTLTNEVVNRGYYYFDWNVSSGDAGEVYTADAVYNMVIDNIKNSSVILFHDFEGNYKTLNSIRNIIIKLKELGYEFKTIDENSPGTRHSVNN